MEKVVLTKCGLFVRHHEGFGSFVFSPYSGCFYAISDAYTPELNEFCKKISNSLPDRLVKHLSMGWDIPGSQGIFDVENWLPHKSAFNGQLPKNQPLVVNWLISSKCNCKCKYCYACDVIDRGIPHESEETVLESIMSLHPLAIVLSGGEPMIEVDRIKKIISAIGKRAGVIVDTNGLIYDAAAAKLFKKNKAVLRVSLDSLSDKINRLSRPLKNDKKETSCVQTIIHNIAKYRSLGIPVIIQTVLSPINKTSLEDMYKQLSRLGVNGWRILLVSPPNESGQKSVYEELMKYGKPQSIEAAYQLMIKDLSIFRNKVRSTNIFPVQIVEHVQVKRNSVLLVLPDGRLATEDLFQSSKIDVEIDDIFSKVDRTSHYERYLGTI